MSKGSFDWGKYDCVVGGLEEDLKEDLEKLYEVAGHKKADLLFQLAWDLGHSCSYHEVVYYYADLVVLLKD